ncbi:MAG TPA: YceI family protein, partial [Segeticoccus sp.]|nr:YceI family protein [Segeticoccus sp.]
MSTLQNLTPGTWTVDPSHSEIGFVARHLMVTKVRGTFPEFEADVRIAEPFEDSSVRATVQL